MLQLGCWVAPGEVAQHEFACPDSSTRGEIRQRRLSGPCDGQRPPPGFGFSRQGGWIKQQNAPGPGAVEDRLPRGRVGPIDYGDGQDASYFFAPGRALDPNWVYAVVGTLATKTGNATYVGISVNDMSKLKGLLNIPDTTLAGSAASYASTVNNTDKFFVHYFARNCNAISRLTDGQCTTITTKMIPLLGKSLGGLFAIAVRAYVRPGTARGPLSSEQLRPIIIQFAQP